MTIVQGGCTLEVALYRMAAHMGSRTVQGGRTWGVVLYRVVAHIELHCTLFTRGHTHGVTLYRVAAHGESHCTVWPHTWSRTVHGGRKLGVVLYSR